MRRPLTAVLVVSVLAPAVAAVAQPASPKPIAVVDSDVPDMEVALLEVKRTSGGTLNVRWSYRNKGSKGVGIGTGVENVEKAYLMDQVNKKKYLVVRDSENVPVAAGHKSDLRAGVTLPVWAKFPAPPESVEKITVVVPHAPPFDDVRITKE
jgi:hypothetical protein